MTSSTTAGSKCLRSARALRSREEVSTGCSLLRAPPRRPRGVRMASTITTSRMDRDPSKGVALRVYQAGGSVRGRRNDPDGGGQHLDAGREEAAVFAVEVEEAALGGGDFDRGDSAE